MMKKLVNLRNATVPIWMKNSDRFVDLIFQWAFRGAIHRSHKIKLSCEKRTDFVYGFSDRPFAAQFTVGKNKVAGNGLRGFIVFFPIGLSRCNSPFRKRKTKVASFSTPCRKKKSSQMLKTEKLPKFNCVLALLRNYMQISQ